MKKAQPPSGLRSARASGGKTGGLLHERWPAPRALGAWDERHGPPGWHGQAGELRNDGPERQNVRRVVRRGSSGARLSEHGLLVDLRSHQRRWLYL